MWVCTPNGWMCSHVCNGHVWVHMPCMSVAVCLSCVLTLRSLEACHGMSLGCYPSPRCQKRTEFAPLTSRSDLCDTFHYYHTLERQRHQGSRYISVGQSDIGTMSMCPVSGHAFGICCIYSKYYKKPKYLTNGVIFVYVYTHPIFCI